MMDALVADKEAVEEIESALMEIKKKLYADRKANPNLRIPAMTGEELAKEVARIRTERRKQKFADRQGERRERTNGNGKSECGSNDFE